MSDENQVPENEVQTPENATPTPEVETPEVPTTPETPAEPTPEPEAPKPNSNAITTEPGEVVEEVASEAAPEDSPVVAGISEKLEQTSEQQAHHDPTAPTQAEPMLVDLNNLKPEQLQVLKAMLNVTPDRAQPKKGNIIIEIRKVQYKGEDKFILDFEQARIALAYDSEAQRDMETHKIRVKLNGVEDMVDMLYGDFMEAERVPVEVISERHVDDSFSEGEVTQRTTGKLVQRDVQTREYFFTVKLPTGEQVEIQGKIANA